MPYSCVKVSKSESSLFAYYEGEKCYSMEKSPIMIDESLELYFGFLTTLEELQKKYGENSQNELMTLYLEEFDGSMYFGLDKETGKLEIVSLEALINMTNNQELENIGGKQFKIEPLVKEGGEL